MYVFKVLLREINAALVAGRVCEKPERRMVEPLESPGDPAHARRRSRLPSENWRDAGKGRKRRGARLHSPRW